MVASEPQISSDELGTTQSPWRFGLGMLLLVVAVLCGFLAGRMSAIRPLEAARRDAETARKEAFDATQALLVIREHITLHRWTMWFGKDPQNHYLPTYWAQTFIAQGSIADKLVLLGGIEKGPTLRFRVLLVEVPPIDGKPPVTVLFESEQVSVDRTRSTEEVLIVDLGNTPLRKGAEYAFVLDAHASDVAEPASVRFVSAIPNDSGDFYELRGYDGERSDHLWSLFGRKNANTDLAFRITYK
jgi:hypothetical protein